MIVFMLLMSLNIFGLWFITGYLKPTFWMGVLYFTLMILCPPMAIALYMWCRPRCKITRFIREDTRKCVDIMNRQDPSECFSYLEYPFLFGKVCGLFAFVYGIFGNYFVYCFFVPLMGPLFGSLGIVFAFFANLFLSSF